jgi:cell division protein ZapA
MSKKILVSVTILDREYKINCNDNDKAGLVAAAELLNNKMSELREESHIVGFEHITVMSALEIAHEFVDYKKETQDYSNITEEITQLNDKIAKALKDPPKTPISPENQASITEQSEKK